MKKCPMMFNDGIRETAECLKNQCAWWVGSECAVVRIEKNLHGIHVKIADGITVYPNGERRT